MDRNEEILELISSYIKEIQKLDLGKDFDINRQIESLESYGDQLRIYKTINPKFFFKNCMLGKDSVAQIFVGLENFNCEYDKLKTIVVRLNNLHDEDGSRVISSSTTHFKYLSENSREKITSLGFNLIDETESKLTYINKEKILVLVVSQRYDPPEVWIKRESDKGALILGPILEQYFDIESTISKKYAKSNYRHFNYSSFDYYFELLNTYLIQLSELGDFVYVINDWNKNKNAL